MLIDFANGCFFLANNISECPKCPGTLRAVPAKTIDLLSTNFHSTPDTDFLVKRLTMAYALIQN